MSDEPKWYRSTVDGELGYLVERDGKQFMKLNRPNEEVLRNYNEAAWTPLVEVRPLSKAALGRVCFEADLALCRALGIHAATQKTWIDLSDKQRIAWMERGPQNDPARRSLWQAIVMVMEPLTR